MASAAYYHQRAEEFQLQAHDVYNEIKKISWLRILVVMTMVFFVYLGFINHIFFFMTPLWVGLFYYLIQVQVKKEDERKKILYLILLNNWEESALNNQSENFPSGDKYIDVLHPYTYDLDFFGKKSVFQYLNRCATALGEDQLAYDLATPNCNQELVLKRQEAIRELASNISFRQSSWAIGKQLNTHSTDLQPLYGWLKEPDMFLGKCFFTSIKWLLPSLTVVSLVLISIGLIFQSVFLGLFLTQLIITGIYSKSISLLQSKLVSQCRVIENYAALFELLKKQQFRSVLMAQYVHFARQAADEVKQFSKKINVLESRMNLIARMFGNGLFLYDFHSVISLEKWRKKNAHSLPIWLRSLAQSDALLSYGTLHYNFPDYAFAEMSEHFTLSAVDSAHLLIPHTARVSNSFDFEISLRMMLITGANMAGKSTFLRSVGVNYILGLNGSPVCAKKWVTPLVKLRTGMRTSDSLQENQSYFFAELNRLKSIIQDLEKGESLIILLDEILKGTNSTDKQTGSRELIKQLIQQKALVMIATHDIALADMERVYPTQLYNVCFEGKIENDQLTFDYKLNKGVAQRANATFLMRKMGIIPQRSASCE